MLKLCDEFERCRREQLRAGHASSADHWSEKRLTQTTGEIIETEKERGRDQPG